MQANTTTGIDAATRHAIITERIALVQKRHKTSFVVPTIMQVLLDRGPMTSIEIAGLTGMTAGSVSSGVHRAIKDRLIEYSGEKRRPRGAGRLSCVWRIVEPGGSTPSAESPVPEPEVVTSSPVPCGTKALAKALGIAEDALYAALELVIDTRKDLVKGGDQ